MASDEEVLSEELHNESVSSYIENILVLQFVLLLFHLIALFYIVRNIIRIPKNGTNYYLLSFLFGIIVFNTGRVIFHIIIFIILNFYNLHSAIQ